MNSTAEISDITIIGGGPVGLFTAFYAGLRQTSVKIIESLPQLGGQLAALYPEKYIYDIAGFPKVRAQELVDNLIEQMNQFETTVCLGETVMQVEKEADGVFKLTTNKEIHYSRTIIITAGNGAFQARKMEIESEEKFQEKNIHYFVQNMNQFEGKRSHYSAAEIQQWIGHSCLNQLLKKHQSFIAATNSGPMSIAWNF